MGVTLRDVARKASVSVSTVSRVLNDYPYIGDSTRESVWEAARLLGYSLDNLRNTLPPARAILLLTQTAGTQPNAEVGVAGIELAMSQGAQAVLAQNGFAVRIQHTAMVREEAVAYAGNAEIAGLIFLGGMADRSFLQELRDAGLPCVVAGSLVRPLPIDSVTADYAGGMQQAVSHLAQSGRRCIGLINGPDVTTSSAEKYKGFRLALALHDLPFTPDQVVTANITPDDGYAGTHQLLEQMPGVDAIAYANDNMAMGGLSALKEMGRQVPADVAVTGFHNYPMSRFTDPPLTTVYTNMGLIGTIAARRLCMLLAGPIEEAWTVLVPTELQVRKSS